MVLVSGVAFGLLVVVIALMPTYTWYAIMLPPREWPR